MTRQRLTKFEFATLFLAQEGRCGCGCGERLEAGKVDEEHTRPVGLDGQAKPDSLWKRDCHKNKTRKDVADIARAKRRAGETGQRARRERRGGSSIQGRNTLSKKERARVKEWKRARTEATND